MAAGTYLFIHLIINNNEIIMTAPKDSPSSRFSDSDSVASMIDLHPSPLCLLLYPSLPPSFSSTLISSPSLSSFLHLLLRLSFTSSFHPPLLLISSSLCHTQRRRSLAEGQAEPDSSSSSSHPLFLSSGTIEANPADLWTSPLKPKSLSILDCVDKCVCSCAYVNLFKCFSFSRHATFSLREFSGFIAAF